MEFTSSFDTSLISIDTSPIYAVFEAYSAIASIICLFIDYLSFVNTKFILILYHD